MNLPFAAGLAVHIDLRGMSRGADGKEYFFVLSRFWYMNGFPVAAVRLIDSFIKKIKGCDGAGMRKIDGFAVRLSAAGKIRGEIFNIVPAVIDGKNFSHSHYHAPFGLYKNLP